MAFGESARAALEHALKAFEAVTQLKVMIGGLEKDVVNFEARHERALAAIEQRHAEQLRATDTRVRELEREVASLRGKVDGAFGEVLKDLARERRSSIFAGEMSADATLHSPTVAADSTDGSANRSRSTNRTTSSQRGRNALP